MAENEEKGFVVKDRRIFSKEASEEKAASETSPDGPAGGDAAAEAAAAEPGGSPERDTGPAADEADAAAGRMAGEGWETPLPEVSFSTFVFSLSSSALVHLGEIPEPSTQERRTDLPMAKQIIDTLGMLHDKTRGNLDADEDRLMKSVLYDLRMRFVQKSGG